MVRLLSEVEASDRDGEDTSERTQRTYLTLPHHDPARDRWVVEAPNDPDRLIGYGSTWARTVWSDSFERAESYLAVHPAWRDKGLGSRLLKAIIGRARELGASHVVIHTNERNRASNTFLQRRGFQPAGSYWLFRTPANTGLEKPQWPKGYTTQAYSAVQDLATLVRAMESYRDMWGHYGPTPGQPRAAWISRADREGVFLVFAPGDEVAGVCVATARHGSGEQAGHIDGPGIMPEHRHQRLHRPLVLTAMNWLQGKGHHAYTLDCWGDDDQTLALYRDLGFEPVQHFISYRYDLS